MQQLDGSPVAVPDDYATLSSLLGLVGGGNAPRLIEGFIQAQTAGVTVRFGDGSQPATAQGGLTVAAGGALGVGPVFSDGAAWPLDRVWVRETSAGGGATVSVLGVAV